MFLHQSEHISINVLRFPPLAGGAFSSERVQQLWGVFDEQPKGPWVETANGHRLPVGDLEQDGPHPDLLLDEVYHKVALDEKKNARLKSQPFHSARSTARDHRRRNSLGGSSSNTEVLHQKPGEYGLKSLLS